MQNIAIATLPQELTEKQDRARLTVPASWNGI